MPRYCHENGEFIFQGTPYKMACALRDARAEVERLQAICREAWESLPATYDDDDPLAARHAAALRGCHMAAEAAGKE